MLALRSDELTVGLALAKGLQSQPAATAESALAALPAAAQGEQSSLLVLSDGLAGSAAQSALLKAASTQMGAGCTLVGGATGRASTRAGSVFANDEVSADALALALLQGPAPIGVGLGHTTTTADAPGAARQAAQQAVAALGGAPVAAAIIVISGTPAEAAADEGSPEVQAIREIIGGAASFVGMYGPGIIAPENGNPGYHPQAVLVYAIGQA
jgi:hypothetical protein